MTDKTVKRIIRILFRVLIDVVIVLILVRVFMVGYNFCYSVFTDHSANPSDTKKERFVIEKEDTTKEIVENLYEAGLVEDEYVTLVKVYLSSYHGKMQPGTYMLSPSMTPSKILKTITDNLDEEETTTEEEEKSEEIEPGTEVEPEAEPQPEAEQGEAS